jgi:hypothetical protein
MTQLRGCDVSTFQDPSLVNWFKYDFGIARATYGTLGDKRVAAHAGRIRAAKKRLGLYHFFLFNRPVTDQFEAFAKVADAVSFGEGDILPCIDVEAFPDRFAGGRPTHYCQVEASWNSALQEFAELMDSKFGGCILYITQRDWGLLGQPSWILGHPLWVANYPKAGATAPLKAPATPANRPYTIWQCMVGPLDKQLQDPNNPRAVDQNITSGELPLIGTSLQGDSAGITDTSDVAAPPSRVPYLLLTDEDWSEMQAARDRHFTDTQFV